MVKHVEYLESLIGEMQLEKALDYIETLSQEEVNTWQIQNLTGIICSYYGQITEAIAFFRRALNLCPDNAEIYFNLADAYLNLQDYQRAELMLKMCEHVTDDEELLNLVNQERNIIEASNTSQDEEQENNLLMVAYYFPPLSGSGVFRPIKHAKYLPELGWKTTVVSTYKPPQGWNYRDDSMMDEIPDCVDVIRVADEVNTEGNVKLSEDEINDVLTFLANVLAEKKEALAIVREYIKSEEGILQLLGFPCSCLCWARDTIKYIEKNMNIRKYSVIYTTSGPASAHLVGYYLKKKYGIPWVADYRDAWTDNPYGCFDINILRHKLLRYLEEILLKNADCNITIEQSMVGDYVNGFGVSREKMVCITNGYDEADFVNLDYKDEKNKKFTITYSGLMYTEHHNISSVLDAISQLASENKIDLNKIRFKIVGQGHEDTNMLLAKHYGLDKIMENTGYVSHHEALQANIDSDILLLLIGDHDRFKPVYAGKVFEYLRAGKPILALAPKDGAVDKLLSATEHGKTFLSTDVSEIKKMILEEYQNWQKDEKNEYLSSPKMKLHERKYLSMKLADVLHQKKRVVEKKDCGEKYLVICTDGYPDNSGGHTNMFAHKRVREYVKAGLNIDVFGFTWADKESRYSYEGIDVVCGGERQLEKMLEENDYKKLLIHFVDVSVFSSIINAGKVNAQMIVWCHGYDVLSWSRSLFEYSEEQIEYNKNALSEQDNIKKGLLSQIFRLPNIHYVFVSNWLVNRTKKFIGFLPCNYEIIHNYIDTDFYRPVEKDVNGKLKVLCIKSHRSKIYANDLTAKAILELSNKDIFDDMEFELYGKGNLFENNYGDLMQRKFPNVHIHQESLNSEEMRKVFNDNIVLLSPTRFDSQGVTSGEGMSAGLCVISCNTAAVPEFMDEECASLVEYDNYMQIVEEIEYLYYHRDECVRKANKARERVVKQCGYDATIAKEIQRILE